MPKLFSSKKNKNYRHKIKKIFFCLDLKKFLCSRRCFSESLKALFIFGHIKNVQNPFSF